MKLFLITCYYIDIIASLFLLVIGTAGKWQILKDLSLIGFLTAVAGLAGGVTISEFVRQLRKKKTGR